MQKRSITTILLLLFLSCSQVLFSKEDSLIRLKTSLPNLKAEEKIRAVFKITTVYINTGELDSALFYGNTGLELTKKILNEEQRLEALMLLSQAEVMAGKTELSTRHLFDLLKLAEKKADTSKLIYAVSNIAANYTELKQFGQAKKFYQRNLYLKEQYSKSKRISSVYINYAGVFRQLQQYDSARFFLIKAITYSLHERDSLNLSKAYITMGNLYQRYKPDHDSALYYYKMALPIAERLHLNTDIMKTMNNLGVLYFEQKQYDAAIQYFSKGLVLAKDLRKKEMEISFYLGLAEAQAYQGDYKAAYNNLTLHKTISDSIQADETKKFTLQLDKLYDTEIKNKLIQQQNLRLKETELALEKNRSRNFLILIIMIFIMGVGIIIFIYYTYKKRSEREIQRAKEKFFSNVVHEIRTPLTLINGPLEQLKKENATTGQLKQIEFIQRNSNRLTTLVNQLLDISKIESQKYSSKESFGDVELFIKSLADSFEQSAFSRNISFIKTFSLNATKAYFDADALEKIVTNLLTNAFKYTNEGGTIELIAGLTNNMLNITVKDNGIGIKEEEQVAVFERFYQSSDAARNKAGGAGIGLSYVKELLAVLNGSIKLTSKEGKGSNFEVQLPVRLFSLEGEVSDEQLEDDIHVLLLEDDTEIAEFCMYILQKEGYFVSHAINGVEGLERIKQIIPDIIITDIMMPGMDGNEFSREIKANALTNHIPVIKLSAKNAAESKVTALQQGGEVFLAKPFLPDELLLLIKNLLQLNANTQKRFKEQLKSKEQQIEKRINTDDLYVKKVVEAILSNLDNSDFGTEELADKLAINRSHLHRKLKALTGYSISNLIRVVRLEKAYELLRKNAGNVTEVAYMTGFSSQSYFTKCFTQEFGKAPKEILP